MAIAAENPFGGGSSGERAQPVHPPIPLLVAAGAVLIAAAAIVPMDQYADWVHVLGWGASSVACIGILAWFTSEDLKRRQSAWYSPWPAVSRTRTALCVLAIVVSGAHAWILAWSLASR
jgi:hypothetical protein